MRRIGFGPAAVRSAFAVAIAAYALVGLFSITGHAGQAREVTAAGSYSAAQATRGKQLYSDQCVACHGAKAEKKFDATKPEDELVQVILKGKKMEKPPNMPGYEAKGINEEQAKALLAHMKSLRG